VTRAAGSPGTCGANYRVPDPCLMPLGNGRVCTLPGDDCHHNGCTDGEPVIRCACTHGPGVHTGGHGRCWIGPCTCATYRDKETS